MYRDVETSDHLRD